MMCGGGGDKGGRKGAGGEDSSTVQIVASTKNTGQRCPMAAMRPHPRNRIIQKSTNILFDWNKLLKLEYTMIITIFMTYFVTTN